MFNRILVPLDGSPEAERVLPWLPSLPDGGRVWLFHALPSTAPSGGPSSPRSLRSPDQARTYLEEVRARLRRPEAEILVKAGHPADRIITASLQTEADLIIMTTGRRAGGSGHLGGVAEAVARGSPLPTLFLSPDGQMPGRRLRRVLLPFDGSARSLRGLEAVRPLVARAGAEAVLLHTRGEGEPAEGRPFREGELDPHAALAQGVRSLQRGGIPARAIVAQGESTREIVLHGQSLDADLIAMGIEGHADTGLWRPILRDAGRAVLLYRAQRAEVVPPPVASVW